MTPSVHRRRPVLFVIAAAAFAGAIFLGWRSIDRHAVAAESIPARPALRGWPAELGDKIAVAEKTATGYRRPSTGLAALGRLYHANGFYDEAIQCYAGLQRLEPHAARWPHFQAGIFAEFGRLDEALPLQRRAVALEAGYLPARLRLGDVLLKSNQTTEATRVYSDVLSREAGNPYALLGLAKCALALGDWTKAREHLEQAIKLHPEFVGALSLAVTVSEHFGDAARATALKTAMGKREFNDLTDPWMESLADDCYDPYRLSVAAALAKFAGDPKAARRRLERAIELAPAAGSYRRQLAKLLLQTRDYAPARQQLEKAVALEPADADAWVLLIEALTVTGDSGAAQRAITQGLASCPQSAALHQVSGEKFAAVGRHAEAIAAFKAARRLRPSEAGAYIDLALVYLQLDRIDEAVTELKGALAVQPGHPLALGVLARHAIDTNDQAAAREWIRQLRLSRVSRDDLNAILAQFQQHFGHAP
ncbi:MAG TPA: tetratricopeptide repeat protein [Opitutaceae bacterium]|nr:tetratricopeptide repeat protein [Opitutaceae bacterium]